MQDRPSLLVIVLKGVSKTLKGKLDLRSRAFSKKAVVDNIVKGLISSPIVASASLISRDLPLYKVILEADILGAGLGKQAALSLSKAAVAFSDLLSGLR